MDIKGHLTKIRYAILDFDGTLYHLDIDYNKLREELKSYLKTDRPLVPLIDCIKKIVRGDDELDGAFEIIDRYEIKGFENGHIIQGTIELLHFFKKRDIKYFIMTRNGKKVVKTFFDKYKIDMPLEIASRDNIKNLKPDPEHINYILDKFRLNKEECIIIGDSNHDANIGNISGIKTILL